MVGCRHPQSCHRQRGRLKPTWAPKGAIQCRYRRSRDVSRADAPPRHDGPLRTGGGLAQTKRRGGCRADSCGRAATGESPGMHEASEPWRVALQAGPGGSLPLAVRMNRNAGKRGAPKPCSRPLSDNRHAAAAAWVGKRKGVKGTLAALAAAPPVSHSEGRIAHQHLATPRPPQGRAMRTRGAVEPCFAPPRTGGANPVVARSVTRRTRPSHSSGSGAGRTGRCAGTRPRPDRC